MKNTILALLATLALIVCNSSAKANGSLTVNGKWAGTAFGAAFDLDGDGAPARTFVFNAYNELPFRTLEGIVDAKLIALPGQGSCTDPNAFELQPSGNVSFRGPQDNVLFTTVDSTHICFNPAAPNEVIHLTIAGGRGNYTGSTGRGTATIHDVVIAAGPTGALLMIDSQGEFLLTVQ